jgi:sugar-specific transcriptional regulator TrmB
MIQEYDKILICLGLTPNQAKIYITLVRNGNSITREISKNAVLARETIYRTLPSLETIGIVERKLTNPTTFEAIPPKEAVQLLLKKQAEKTREIEKKSLELIMNLKKDRFAEIDEDRHVDNISGLTLLFGLKAFNRNVCDAIQNARESFDGITTPQNFRVGMREARKDFKNALLKGVKFRHIVTKSDSEFKDIGDQLWRKNSCWQVRYSLNHLPVDLVIIDRNEVFIAIPSSEENAHYLRSTAPSLVAMANNYFETYWNNSTRLLASEILLP